jgi:hypothetical protein
MQIDEGAKYLVDDDIISICIAYLVILYFPILGGYSDVPITSFHPIFSFNRIIKD